MSIVVIKRSLSTISHRLQKRLKDRPLYQLNEKMTYLINVKNVKKVL